MRLTGRGRTRDARYQRRTCEEGTTAIRPATLRAPRTSLSNSNPGTMDGVTWAGSSRRGGTSRLQRPLSRLTRRIASPRPDVADDWERVDAGDLDLDLMASVGTVAEDYEPLDPSADGTPDPITPVLGYSRQRGSGSRSGFRYRLVRAGGAVSRLQVHPRSYLLAGWRGRSRTATPAGA